MAADLSIFWSYSHADDESDRGRVKLLAEHLANEVRVLSGKELDLFVDRKSIGWGDEWRQKIDGALSASTFMVAVLSPTYFKRPECRKEFIDFYREADSRALDRLLLPISYAAVADFDEDNPDEVVAIASRYQYEHWASIRLKDPESGEYRGRVNQLAVRVLELHRAMTDKERAQLVKVESEPGAFELGFFEALKQLDARLPTWVEAVEQSIVRFAQYYAIDSVYEKRLREAPPGKQLAIRHRYATDELEVMAVSMDLARRYSSLSIEMAPYVAAVLRGAAESAAVLELLRPLYDAVLEAKTEIDRPMRENAIWARDYWAKWEKLGGVFKELISSHERSADYREEGNTLVQEWHRDLATLFEDNEGTAPAIE